MATDRLFAAMPWVEQEQVVLSPSHPPIECACPDVAGGGKKGDGVYPKGEIILPIHVQCLCFKEAVLMDDREFIGKLRGWMTGQAPWAEMDEYARWLGVELPSEPAVPGTAPAAGAVGPQGKAVSEALALPKWGKYAVSYEHTLKAIDGVHGDGTCPRSRSIRARASGHWGRTCIRARARRSASR